MNTHETTSAVTLVEEPSEPTRVGRYVIIDRIGAGGMGVVYRAYDPELDRKVAVKLLLPGRTSGQERLAREARAMAQVSHPNVVPVHDVGNVDARLFIAMDFVDGQSLRDWMRAQQRRPPEIVALFRGAAAGLAAAHEAGVVHRDFKPDNVLVDRKGRPQVTDFGLAAGVSQVGDTGESHDSPEMTRLTRAGATVGTPAYMAPEQFEGETVDARSDQFSFCVALWEALWGQRPFAGATAAELGWAVTHGQLRLPPTPTPAWLFQVLLRGLSTDPARRWPSMTALLNELEHGEARVRRTRIGYGVLVVLLVAGAVAGGLRYDRARRVSACEAEGAEIVGLWNEESKARLREALVDTGVSYAAKTFEKLVPWMEAYSAAWRTARTDACLDTRLRGMWDEDTLDRSVWCLEERRMEFAALAAELMDANETAVQKAVQAAAGLSSVSLCRDEHRLKTLPPLPQNRNGVQAIHEMLARTAALRVAGKYREGLAESTEALSAAEQLGWPPLIAAANWNRGELLGVSGKYAEAENALEDAYFQGTAVGALEVAGDAAARLTHIVGHQQARHDDGLRWSRHAEAIFSLIGVGEESLRRADAFTALAGIYESKADYGEAKSLFTRALVIREKVLGREHPLVAMSLNNVAIIHESMEEYDEAKLLHSRTLAMLENSLGPDHPLVATSLNNLGVIYDALEEYGEAKTHYRRALTIYEKALGPDSTDVAMTLHNLANVHESIEEYEEAKTLFERALSINEAVLGFDHPTVASTLSSLGIVYRSMGANEKAKEHYERALTIYEKTLGPDHPYVARTIHNLARVYEIMGVLEEASTLHRRSLAIREKAMGLDHPDVIVPLTALTRIALVQNRPTDAVALAERIMRIRSNNNTPAESLASSRFLLARALWDAPAGQGGDRNRALTLALQARDALRSIEGADADELAEMEAFLTQRGDSP